jgi:hypothetical protein
MRPAILAMCVGLAGVAVGWLAHRPGAPTPAPATMPVAAAPRSALPAAPIHRGVTADEVRAILDEKLAALPAAPSAPEAASTALPADPPTARVVDPRGIELIDDAVADGTWDDRDREALQDTIAELPPPDAYAAIRRLAVAVNEGSVAITTDGPPF